MKSRLLPLLFRSIRAFLITLLLTLLPSIASAQWRKLPLYPGTFFNEVFFIDNSSGWITGFSGTVLRTADGGLTWNTSTLPGASSSANRDICFVSASTGFVSGDDGIWKTLDGGATWTSITPTNPSPSGSSSMWFTDADNGVYGFGGCAGTTVTFCSTSDGGATWASVTYDHTTPDVAVGGICYMAGAYYAVGGNGKGWKSTDGGVSWTATPTGSAGWQEDIVAAGGTLFVASANGTSCGSTGGGKILKSHDGASTWASTSFATTVMWGISMYSAMDGWSCGDNGNAYRTSNGGVSWTSVACGFGNVDRVDDICFTDATHGWAVGDGIYQFVGDYFVPARDTIDFGDILVGAVSADSLTGVLAVGGAGTILSAALGGSDASQFQVGGANTPVQVPSCQRGGMLTRFIPKSEGVKYGHVDFNLSDFTPVPRVVVKGRGVKPRIFGASGVAFDTLACETKTEKILSLRNDGTYPLTIDSAIFSKQSGGRYRVRAPALPLSIPPGGSADIVVEETATGFGAINAEMQLYNNDAETGKSPFVVRLGGYRTAVRAQIAPDTLVTVPAAAIGTTSQICVRYTNTGDGEQIIETVRPIGTMAPIRLVDSVKGVRLPKFGYHEICFEAEAGDTSLHTRQFLVRTQPCNVDTIITVRYKARNPSIVTGDAVVFDNVSCGLEAFDTIDVSNKGDDRLILQNPRFVGTDSTEFTVVLPTSWPDTIAVAGSTRIVVRFTPTKAKVAHSASIVLPNNDLMPGRSDRRVSLSASRNIPELVPLTRRLDLGPICLNDTPRSARIAVRNSGTLRASGLALEPAAGDGITTAAFLHAVDLEPSKWDTVAVEIVPSRMGAFSERHVIRYEPCGLSDTIEIVGTVVGVTLASTPPTIDFGASAPGSNRRRTIMLENRGNIDAAVIELLLDPPIPGLEILSPLGTFALTPGGSIEVEIGFATNEEIDISALLKALYVGDCADTVTVAITGRVTSDPVIVSRTTLDLGDRLSCEARTASDSVVLSNLGSGPVTVRSVRLTSGASFTITPPVQPDMQIAPGDSIVVTVIQPIGQPGEMLDTLLVEAVGEKNGTIRIPIRARYDIVAYDLQDLGPLPSYLPCDRTTGGYTYVTNSGTVADTVTLSSNDGRISFPDGERMILEPGERDSLRVVIDGTLDETVSGTITARSGRCDIMKSTETSASLIDLSTAMEDVDLGTIPVGETGSGVLTVTNSGEAEITIESMSADGDAAISATFTDGRRSVPAGGSLPLDLGYAPTAAGASTTTVTIVISAPCRDTIVATVSGVASLEERYEVGLAAGNVTGRWGDVVDVPIALSNEESARFLPVVIDIVASPALLDPIGLSLHEEYAAVLTVDRVGYDPSTGRASYRISTKDPGIRIPTTEAFLTVRYEVLRGDSISTPVEAGVPESARNVRWRSSPGLFSLADYCDAHGRLLRIEGGVALKQNAPNPFNPSTTIEFEIPFRGHVILSVRDLSGREVARPVDEVLPAGRRRLVFDGSNLPSGLYFYELTVGRNTIRRRMTLTK